LTLDIMGGFGTFFLPFWILDVLVTGAVLLVVATVLKGRAVSGVVAAIVCVFVAYVIAFLLPTSEHRSNQLLISVWMLLVVSAVWATKRFRGRDEARKVIGGASASAFRPGEVAEAFESKGELNRMIGTGGATACLPSSLTSISCRPEPLEMTVRPGWSR
jgi:hypothetical protein